MNFHSLDSIRRDFIYPHFRTLLEGVWEKKRAFTLDGIFALSANDVFINGKTLAAASYYLCSLSEDSPEFVAGLAGIRDLAELFAEAGHEETWSLLYALMGFYALEQRGLLDRALDGKTRDAYLKKLDWRSFVRTEDLSLIDKPTNYYHVAMGIAKFRELLGWEGGNYSADLFKKLLDHIDRFSSDFGFMDDTPGEGRYDRYTVLIPAELVELMLQTSMEIPEKLKTMLAKSCDIMLDLANPEGKGFAYGRSLSAYGDLAPLQVLSFGNRLGLLGPREKKLAHAYCLAILNRYRSFWIDSDRGSLNMWENGRRTDAYRHKGRILGENFSTGIMILNALEAWSEDDLHRSLSEEELKNFDAAFLPPFKFYFFEKREFQRGLCVRRDGNLVVSLPLISGGDGQHDRAPYLPVPNVPGLLETPPDSGFSQLLPLLCFFKGIDASPGVYFTNIETGEEEGVYRVVITQKALNRLGKSHPQPFDACACETVYSFGPGFIKREDSFFPREELQIEAIKMDFLSFDAAPTLSPDGKRVVFSGGGLLSLETEGYDSLSLRSCDDGGDYDAPTGRLGTHLLFRKSYPLLNEGLRLSWTLRYRIH